MGQQSMSGRTFMPSPCQSVSHNRRDHLAHKMGGPEMGAHIQCTHDATWGREDREEKDHEMCRDRRKDGR